MRNSSETKQLNYPKTSSKTLKGRQMSSKSWSSPHLAPSNSEICRKGYYY